jgi:hypothetical protein
MPVSLQDDRELLTQLAGAPTRRWRRAVLSDVGVFLVLALALVLIHTAVNGQYGSMRRTAHFYQCAISGMSPNGYRGYGDPPPETVNVLGERREFMDRAFESCTLARHLTNRYGIANSSVAGWNEIFVCTHTRQPWPEFWKHLQHYS